MRNTGSIKLKDSIPSNSLKIIEIYNKIDNGLLITQPNYQRKLVWKKQHKFAFIDTILLNYPFPEVYIASSDIDVERMVATEVVVDGQQRLTTIVEYIKGEGDFGNQKKITSFNELNPVEKKEFLNYNVSVKDLKDIGDDLVKEIFQRINSTEYSLNTVEKNNAQFGDGEIAIFCKQLIDIEFIATLDETDIVLDPKIKKEINDFFFNGNIFSVNDKKRMYDFQFIMLLLSTFLEGSYYGRSSKVDEYLEKYNSSFDEYQIVLDLLLKSIRAISTLGFSQKSYWFNKANLFSLIIQLSKIDTDKLNYVKLEIELRDLEDKVDLYFSEEFENGISDDEKKYFEVARQGSHEKASREHRGKVLERLLKSCIELNGNDTAPSLEKQNIEILKSKDINFVTISPTNTGLRKSIMDATSPVRDFLAVEYVHDYATQGNGKEYKVSLDAQYILEDTFRDLKVSLYRATKRGDARIWFSELKGNSDAGDILAIISRGNGLYVVNISKFKLDDLFKKKHLLNMNFV